MIKPVIYNGESPYIFISYSHRNTELVWSILDLMQREGYRFWYDDGIEAGTSWDDNIAEHVEGSGYFIAFLSEEYLASSNCVDELNYAISQKKTILLVFLDEARLQSGLRMRLSMSQAIHYDSSDERDFPEKLRDASGIADFRTSREEDEKRLTHKELIDRGAKAIRYSCFCEALYLEREALDSCLQSCFYHMGLIARMNSPRVRDKLRPLLQEALRAEENPAPNLSISSLENKLQILRGLLLWSSDASALPDEGMTALAARLRQLPSEPSLQLLQDVDDWRTAAREITAGMANKNVSVASKRLAEHATVGHQCAKELAAMERTLRRGNTVRRAFGLPVDLS